jgi:regulator of protease activity HflC (stomatin/prohibitin superfamily)
MKYIIGIVALTLIVTLVSCSGVTQVDTGHRGIKTSFGKVTEGPLTEGIYFYSPFVHDIVQLDTRTQIMNGSTMAYTKDVQQTQIVYVLNYSLRPDAVVSVYQNIGHDWAAKIVVPVVEAIGNEAIQVLREKVNQEASDK